MPIRSKPQKLNEAQKLYFLLMWIYIYFLGCHKYGSYCRPGILLVTSSWRNFLLIDVACILWLQIKLDLIWFDILHITLNFPSKHSSYMWQQQAFREMLELMLRSCKALSVKVTSCHVKNSNSCSTCISHECRTNAVIASVHLHGAPHPHSICCSMALGRWRAEMCK